MNISMHGRKVSRFVYGVKGCDPDFDMHGKSFQEPPSYVFSATYHGDRDEFWILLMVDGKEIMRWNARYIASIEWEEAP